jgi:primosomal protein N'
MSQIEEARTEPLYCPHCDQEVDDPLVCGDCGAVICRRCGAPLEKVDELGIG